MPALAPILVSAAGVVGGVILFVSGFSRLKLRRAVADTPTSRLRSAALGRVELKGRARCLGAPLVGPFSGLGCVWCHIRVEEERLRSGKGGTRREWVTVHEQVFGPRFGLDDGTGQVAVDPEGAQVEAPLALEVTTGGLFARFRAPLPPGPSVGVWAAGGFGPRRRLTEWSLLDGAPLYALGVLRAVPGVPGGTELGNGRFGEPYFLSYRDEGAIVGGLSRQIAARMALGALIAVAAAAFVAWRYWGWR